MMTRLRFLLGAMVLIIAGCASDMEPMAPGRGTLDLPVMLLVTGDAQNGYDFQYSGRFTDKDGNIDVSVKGAKEYMINLTFRIAPGSVEGLEFMRDGRNAMWIAKKENVGPDGSPVGPYRGKQFDGFTVSGDGKSLTVFNMNDDNTLYRYGLRFDLNGETVIDDPDYKSGGGNH